MYKINDYLVYKKEVCRVKDILENYIKDIDYYLLEPVIDSSLSIKIPVSSKDIRDLKSKEEIENLINKIPDINIIKSDNKVLDSEYKEKIKTGNLEDLIIIIKTAYLRNKERTDNNKKMQDADVEYFNIAEKYLYSEIAVVLDMSYDKTKEYVINRVEKIS